MLLKWTGVEDERVGVWPVEAGKNRRTPGGPKVGVGTYSRTTTDEPKRRPRSASRTQNLIHTGAHLAAEVAPRQTAHHAPSRAQLQPLPFPPACFQSTTSKPLLRPATRGAASTKNRTTCGGMEERSVICRLEGEASEARGNGDDAVDGRRGLVAGSKRVRSGVGVE